MLIVNILNDDTFEIETPRYVRKSGDVWIKCGDYRAEAIAIQARLYKIRAKAGDIYYVEPYDTGDRIMALSQYTRQSADDLMNASFELDAQREEIIEALFEIDARLEGLING